MAARARKVRTTYTTGRADEWPVGALSTAQEDHGAPAGERERAVDAAAVHARVAPGQRCGARGRARVVGEHDGVLEVAPQQSLPVVAVAERRAGIGVEARPP